MHLGEGTRWRMEMGHHPEKQRVPGAEAGGSRSIPVWRVGVARGHTLPKQSRGSVPEYPQSWTPMGVVEKVSFLSSSIPR